MKDKEFHDISLKRPILVTGSHRSGSTWIGTIIGKSDDVCYIWEPFNKDYGPGICSARFDYYFPYITEENEDKYLSHIHQTLQYKYHLWEEIKSIRRKKQIYDCLKYFTNFNKAKLKKQRPLFKDPLAIFSAEWLYQCFDFQVVVLIRHPASFVSSIKRLNWTHPFEDFLKQPLLVNGPLKQYKHEIEDFARNPRDIMDQSIMLWNLINFRILQYQRSHPDWIFMRYEDIASEPIACFKHLFNKLNLLFLDRIERRIQAYSSSSNPAELPVGNNSLKKNSRLTAHNWKRRLTQEEINRIKSGVEDISSHFYAESEW